MSAISSNPADLARAHLARANRIVVKLGTRVLAQSNGRPDPQRMRMLVRQLVQLHRSGREVAVVSSGAIGAGMESLGLRRRPRTVPDLQMAAAVGQSELMARYHRLFGAHRCKVGQVLLTHDGLKMRERHLNARTTLMNLLRHRIVPIINENDTVSVDEIRFGDNDMLASLVSILIDADLLILLTRVNGLRAPAGKRTRRVPYLPSVTQADLDLVFGHRCEISTGGMASKLQAADMFARSGGTVVIADGRKPDVLDPIIQGKDIGTLIGRPPTDPARMRLDSRRRWIAFFHRAEGSLLVDDGAARALEEQGKSLLPIGVHDVIGDFPAGAVVNIKTRDGRLMARGLSSFSSADARRILGRKTSELPALLGTCGYEEIIHRDNLIILSRSHGGTP